MIWKSLATQIKNGWLICGVTLMLLAGIELASRALLAVYRRTSAEDLRAQADAYKEKDWTDAYFQELRAPTRITQWHSYVYWRHVPFSGEYIKIDEQGRRYTWNAPPPSNGTDTEIVHIFTFGGSAMWGTGAKDDETIPSVLARLIAQERKLPVNVTNFGEGGYVSTQGVITLLRELQKGQVPDIVIFYDGVNDAFSARQNANTGLPQNEYNRIREFNLLHPSRRDSLYKEALWAAIQDSATTQVLIGLMRRVVGTGDPDEEYWSPSDQAKFLASETVRVYAENIKIVKSLEATYGFKALFYWQPVVFTKVNLSPYEQQIQKRKNGWYYLTVRDEVEKQLTGVAAFHDLSAVFGDDSTPYFIDFCHVTGEGNAVIARRILQDVEPLIHERNGKAEDMAG